MTVRNVGVTVRNVEQKMQTVGNGDPKLVMGQNQNFYCVFNFENNYTLNAIPFSYKISFNSSKLAPASTLTCSLLVLIFLKKITVSL